MSRNCIKYKSTCTSTSPMINKFKKFKFSIFVFPESLRNPQLCANGAPSAVSITSKRERVAQNTFSLTSSVESISGISVFVSLAFDVSENRRNLLPAAKNNFLVNCKVAIVSELFGPTAKLWTQATKVRNEL